MVRTVHNLDGLGLLVVGLVEEELMVGTSLRERTFNLKLGLALVDWTLSWWCRPLRPNLWLNKMWRTQCHYW